MSADVLAQPADENEPFTVPSAGPSRVTEITAKSIQPVPQKSFYAPPAAKKTASKVVIGEKSAKQREAWGGAVFNPEEEGAVVMQRPPKEVAIKR